MPFTFLKYLQPTHYFRLKTETGKTVFPKIEALPNDIVNQLEKDSYYQSEVARNYDLSWQAIHYGYIGNTSKHCEYFHCKD